MRYTIALQLQPQRALISSEPGFVVFNGQRLLPMEAEMLAQALSDCADSAENLAAKAAAALKPAIDSRAPEAAAYVEKYIQKAA